MTLTIGFPHKPPKKGGPGVFQKRFESAIKSKGWKVVYPEDNILPDAVLVVGGTKKLGWLLKLKFKKVPIVYRLDGMSWLHREPGNSFNKRFTAEVGNALMNIIRTFFASHIVYQSVFVEKWWKKSGWRSKQDYSIIRNGVDTELFQPRSEEKPELCLLCIEGNIDYTPFAFDLLNKLQEKLIGDTKLKSLVIYGSFDNPENKKKLSPNIDYRGSISNDKIFEVYKNSIFLSLDINAACPNTVIESLASGIPVIGFDTGALKELVEDAGSIVDYGGDPWKIETPDMDGLVDGAIQVKKNWEHYSEKARSRAIENFNIDDVVNKYLAIINKEVKQKS
ncbi:glycosyltransferase family 4 protein [Labilibacter sediminis]|nr:glycosyltransferase family 4 protein [Labilibacter sediminis]